MDRIESLGLKASDHYFISSDLVIHKARARRYEYALDANLGYTYVGDSGEYGVSKSLVRCEERYKIVTLGGSTTDGELYSFRSWPECLWDKVEQNYVSIYI